MNIKTIICGALKENCYIVEKNNQCLKIDPGDEREKIIKEIKNKPIGILVTHCHFDHVGALTELNNLYNVPIYKYDNLEEKTITIGDFKIDVIYTKGHTEDSVTYYFKDEKIMFTGDFLFKNSIGRTDLPTGSDVKMKESIAKIKLYDDDIKIYPGHGEDTTLNLEKKYNYYLK